VLTFAACVTRLGHLAVKIIIGVDSMLKTFHGMSARAATPTSQMAFVADIEIILVALTAMPICFAFDVLGTLIIFQRTCTEKPSAC